MHTGEKIALLTALFLFVFGVALVPPTAEAQGLLAPRSDTDTEETSDTDDDEDSYEASGLPIPVLFGPSIDTISPNFGDPRGGGSRIHEGLDMMAPAGTPIVSPTDAEVERIGSYSGAGRYVITEADSGERFYYYHLEDQADYLDRGDDIDVGDLIGFVGSSGNAIASAPHLHLEIREGRRALDPYPYFTHDFTLEEKMDILEEVFDDARDEDELAEFLVDEFINVFQQAQREGIDIPGEIERELPDNFEALAGLPARDLTVGARGGDVRTLQQILIDGGYIEINSPTGYFGPLTEEALAGYQRDNGISPAVGYYGPVTRSHMAEVATSIPVATDDLSQSEMLDQIEELRQQIEALRGELTN